MAYTTETTRVSPGLSAIEKLLKLHYADGKVPEDILGESPFVAKLKVKGTAGSSIRIPIIYGDVNGIARTRAASQSINQAGANAAARATAWNVEVGDLLQTVSWSNKEISAAKGDKSFVDQASLRLRSAGREGIRMFGALVLGPSGRALSSGTISAGVITLARQSDVIKFAIGMQLEVSATSGAATGTLLVAALGHVIALDKSAGTVTVSATAGGSAGVPTGWTGTMYIFSRETYGGLADNVILRGLEEWVPEVAPTSGDNFYGVDRSVDPVALAGVRVAAAKLTGKSMLDRLKTLATEINVYSGGRPSECYVHTEDWQAIETEFQSLGIKDNMSMDQKYGFSSLKLVTATGVVSIIADPFVRKGHAFMLDTADDNVVMYNMMTPAAGKSASLFVPFDADGNKSLRFSSSDSVEVRLVSYPAFVVRCPGKCGRVALY